LSAVFLNLTEAILYLDTTRIWRFIQSGTSRLRRENLGAVHVALGILMFCSILHAALPFTGLTNGGDLSAINLILRYPMLLFMFAMGIILNRRAAASDLEGARLKSELEAAVEIQRLMLPESQSAEVDAVYLPAAEVGGDFYQILPRSDGSRLIVVGDVSGKGLRAAMLVPLVIGALRHEQADSPAAVLAGLNRVLHGQTGNGFVTCCCLHVSPGGEVRIANAGHLAPYYRGKEMSMESGLDLPPKVRQTVKTQISANGELSHGTGT